VWRQLDRRRHLAPEVALPLALAVWTLVPCFVLLSGHGVFNGAYGVDVPDAMQYMAFVRDAGQHVLISNRFDVVADRHLFLDPVFALSGLVWRLGASIQAAQLLWVPIAAVALFAGFMAYARRLLGPDRGAIAAALVLAFFYLAPATALAAWLHWGPTLRFGTEVVGLEMFAGSYAWGGGPAIAVALMPICLLAIERLLDRSRRAPGRSASWYSVWAGVTGALSMWLHPWQGITLLVIIAGVAVWGRMERNYRLLVLPALLTAAPLVYYFALSRTHSSWMVASRANGYSHFGWWLALGFAPALLALPGFRGRNLDLQERMLRIWPVAAFVVYLILDRTWFYHAFVGLSLPLAILVVKGWRRLRVPRTVTVAAVVVATVPGLAWAVEQLISTNSQHFFRGGEARALAFLNRASRPGAVLAPAMPLGQSVPAFAGRQTYVGHYYWTPDYNARAALTEALFDGRLPRAQGRQLVRSSQAAFLASDCRPGRVDLRPLLGGIVTHTWRFGCAMVYEVGG
jgi:hypothetical protein